MNSRETSQRRVARVFIRDTSELTLQAVVREAPNKRSNMKVATLEDSLRSIQSSGLNRRRSSVAKTLSWVVGTLVTKKSMANDIPTPNLLMTEQGFDSGSLQRKDQSFFSRETEASRSTVTSAISLRAGEGPDQNHVRVKFGMIELREYEMVATDNPGVSRGVAVGLGWAYDEMGCITVEEFEMHHPPRRQMKDMRLSVRERMKLLSASGYTQREMQKYAKAATVAKRKRRKTLDRLKFDSFEEKVEHWKDLVLNKMRLRKTEDQADDDLWHMAQVQANQSGKTATNAAA